MILLTGSSGFIAQEIANQNKVSNFKFLQRSINNSNNHNTYNIDFLAEDICWGGACVDVCAVIHLAALAHGKGISPSDVITVNVSGTLKLAKEAAKKGVKRFVFVSSIGVNGSSTNSQPFSEHLPTVPHDFYSKSKYDAEIGLKKIAAETGLEVVIVRPTLVYGANAPGNFGLLTKLITKLPILPFGLADNRRDFIAVQNLADLLLTCATHPDAAGHTFLASDGETVSIKELTNAMAQGLNKKVIQLPIPVSLMKLAGKLTGKSAMIEQLFGNLEVDSSNIKQVLDWTPPLTMKQAMACLRDSAKSSSGND